MKVNFILFCLVVTVVPCFSQIGPTIVQNIVAGGDGNDRGLGMDSTFDRGVVIAGITYSHSNSLITRRVANSNSDALVMRYDLNGDLMWSFCYGGTNNDVMNDIIQTMDGGFIAVGKSNSVDFDLPATNDATFSNIWIVKLSAAGAIEWSKTYGGTLAEDAMSVLQLADGSYVVAGVSESTAATSPFGTALGSKDLVLIKLDVNGNNPLFNRLGGNREEQPAKVIQLTNGNLVVVGSTTTLNNGIITGNHSSNISLTSDIWVVWLNSNLVYIENRCYGSSKTDNGFGVEEMSNGDLIIGGMVSFANEGDVRQLPSHAGTEGWIARIKPSVSRPLDTVWTRPIGGNDADNFRSMVKTSDGHVVVALLAQSGSNVNTDITDKISTGNIGDVWVAKFNTSNAEILFKRSYGTSVADDVDKIMIWKGDNLLFVGTLQGATRDADLTGQPAYGATDLWMASAKDISSPLPIVLSRFSGKVLSTCNSLQWQTESESNSKEFWIERSQDDIAFKVIGVIKAAEESNIPRQYEYNDYEMPATATYRLRLVDKDNSFTVSHVITLRRPENTSELMKAHVQYNTVVFSVNSDKNEPAVLQLLDAGGQLVGTRKTELLKGYHSYELNPGILQRGVYIAVLIAGNKKSAVKIVR